MKLKGFIFRIMTYSAAQMIVLTVVFSTLAILIVRLRIWARKLTRAKYDLNDLLIMLALVKFHF